MAGCDYCDEKFSSDRERLEHEFSEHGDEMTGHEKDDKKSELNRLEQKKKTEKHNRRKKLQYGLVGLLLVGLVAGGGYYAYQNADTFAATQQTNESMGIGTPVHWHAPYRITVCGEEKVLQGGPTMAHTHGETKFHLEGVRQTREQATLDWIIDQLGGEFSNTGIMGYKEPESCPGSSEPGNLTVKVNGNVIDDPENYVVRDGDFVRIKYE